jgi:hypothetical protein
MALSAADYPAALERISSGRRWVISPPYEETTE